VLVIGSGPVGQTAAALLRRWAVDVRLFDARPERDPVGSKAICQARDVLDVWESVGVGMELAREGTTWTTARTFFRDREISAWQFQDRGCSVFPAFVNVGQQRTEELLDDALARAGVQTSWGTELVGLSQSPTSVRATFRRPEGLHEVTGSHVVLATGARGDALRSALGLTFDGETFDDQFLICDIKAELAGWENERRFYFDPEWNPGRQVLIHACPNSTYRIDWQVPSDYNLAQDEASGGLDARIRAIVGDREYEIRWKSVYRFHIRHADPIRVDRVLLAGDVAHLVSPFGARGLNTGVFDAENVAWKIAYERQGWAGPGLLESYNSERMAATLENIEVTRATMSFLVPQTAEAARERQKLLLQASADPEVAARVDSGRFAEPFWYTASPLTTQDRGRPFEGRPPKGHTPAPAPGVLVPDHPVSLPGSPDVTRLRQLLRLGFAVLLTDSKELAVVQRAAKEATDSPVRVLVLCELEGGAEVIASLGMSNTEAWVIRPDAYIAAVVMASDAARLTEVIRRALGY
jgi:3-(3-hydroxy-phenyl)propionate hydroxylase